MTEPLRGKALQKAILDLAHRLGWRTAHFPAVETVQGWRTAVGGRAKGFPDLVLVRERLIIAEIKGDGDSLKPEQKEWLDAFTKAGVENYVWRPKDWREGRIEIILHVKGFQT